MPRTVTGVMLLGVLFFPPSAAGQTSAPAQSRPPFQVGIHGGFDFSDGDVDGERIGLQGSIPVVWRLTVDPVFSYLYDFPDDRSGTFEGSAWQSYLTLRVHPFVRDFLAVGYGFTLAHASLRTTDGTFEASDTEATDVGVIALTLPTGRVRPFAEVYLVDLLERRSAVGGNLLFGLNLRVP